MLGLGFPSSAAPLPHQLRPALLHDVVGHDFAHKHRWIVEAIEQQRVVSAIFWGPPGVGKTTIATIIAKSSQLPFHILSAVSAGKKEIQDIVAQAEASGRPQVLFLDEIHRFTKAQQDVLLPYMESGRLILIGATTENPSFALNNALLSRCRIVVLESLSKDDLQEILDRGIARLQQQQPQFSLDNDAVTWLANFSNGDARYALNMLESLGSSRGAQRWSLDAVQLHCTEKSIQYDRDGEQHYDLISALHKSIRSSDVQAALYWLARMLEAGETPLYLARRLVRIATEDVGLADPKALTFCLDAERMFSFLGSPEGEQGLFQAAAYLALAPKSNALYLAEKAARKLARETHTADVPIHLRNAPTKMMKDLGYGQAYQYAHDYKNGVVTQKHFPDSMEEQTLYQPTTRGFEKTLLERQQWLLQKRNHQRQTLQNRQEK